MKVLLFYLVLVLLFFCSYGQTNQFKLTYQFVGLGGNMFRKFYPIVKIENGFLTYSIERNTAIKKIQLFEDFSDTTWNTEIIDTRIKLSLSIIDSLYNLVRPIKKTLIFESTGGIGGGFHAITISDRSFKLKYELQKVCDTTAVKITNILDTYLPISNKIRLSKYDVDIEESFQQQIKLVERELALKEKELKLLKKRRAKGKNTKLKA